jgi:ectoine hydroxylase-related dioxygenase (phytanoyl-CoA dioxygenase family)
LSTIVGLVCTDDDNVDRSPWCLYKEKLNIKPAGSSGFAPHLDSPSLRVTGLCDTFVTVMIAIDDMTVENGCLQVCKGRWNEANSLLCEPLAAGGDNPTSTVSNNSLNPDGNGRRGAIIDGDNPNLKWEPIECVSGDVFIFSGWLPHRSSANASQLPRRAVFLTYNHSEDGELSETYYRIMAGLRANYLKQYVAAQSKSEDEK